MKTRTPMPLAPLDERQRYTLDEASRYLRASRPHLYKLMADGVLPTIKEGRRRFVPGASIARLSRAGAE